ncbi:RNA polymerase II transcriptional coactivator KIWI-like [Macadamia integrifolia]|uniref:RNA polymerase II transcriptional coactivator KIWI-like n=1 Tax=Macadamia integrifolia TaxID=60698 RepID=UPI001C4FE106|nr:RNA polymerase II transcriptional coactivator KIWI-like [Macadamia integrifolia]
MSRWGKRKDKGGFASDDDSDHGGAPAKKNARKGSDDSDEIVVCDLSKNRRVKVRNFQGKTMVDIREFYYKDGKELPGKKGISLSMDQWKVLRDHADEIDNAVMENT